MTYSADDWPIGAALLQFPSAHDAAPETWSDVLEEVADAGFSHVDLTTSWVRPGDLDRGRLDELARRVKMAGLRVSAISLSRQSVIHQDEDVAAVNLASALRTIDAALVLGTSVVGTGLHVPLTAEQQQAMWFWHARGNGNPPDERVRATAVERLRQLGSYAAERGVQVSLEMYEDTFLGTADEAVRLVRDIGLPNVGINPDIGNLIRQHRPVESWRSMLDKVLPHANFWHLKNYFRDFDPATGAYFTAPAPAESGMINYRQALRMALDAGFSGPICVEHYGGDGLSVAAANRDYLRRILRFHLRGR
jgi:sugar phosphate isomerase/epimerase